MPVNCNHVLHAGGIINSSLEHRNKLRNAFNTAHMYKPTNQERLLCKMFLVFIKKIPGFTFTMSNYSYRLLSRCDKQLGSHLVLLHETILGLTRMATEQWLRKIRSLYVVRLVATVLYTSSIKDHYLKIDFTVSRETL